MEGQSLSLWSSLSSPMLSHPPYSIGQSHHETLIQERKNGHHPWMGEEPVTELEDRVECNTTIFGKHSLPHPASGHSTSHPSPMQKRMALLPQDSQDSSLWALGSISSLRYHYLNQVQRWQRLLRCDSSPLFEHSSLVLYPYELNREFTTSPMCPVCMHGEQP